MVTLPEIRSSQQELYHVLSDKVVKNVRVLSYGEMEILVEVKLCNPGKVAAMY